MEERDIQTRPVFTGNVLRQPAMANVRHRAAPEGYPMADDVMRGGILLACHHGLDDAQIDHMHRSFRSFADCHAAPRPSHAACAA
jgi:CDP-6-deoxy-D-xylo-4-hexulose-3-dehydrase